MSKKSKRRATRDNFESATARLGLDQDNMLAQSGYRAGRNITTSITELEDMYRTSWVVGRMVEVVAEDMVRAGLSISSQMDPGDTDALMRDFTDTGVPGRLSDAIKWGRLYGGSLAVLLIDGHDLSTPLDLDMVERHSFRGLYVLDRHHVTPTEEKITELGPMLGYPAGYRVNDDALSGITIHHSRVLRFVGVELPLRERIREQYWGGSVVERAFDRILALDSSTYGVANLMLKAYLRVVNIKGLRKILAEGGVAETGLVKQMKFIREMQSNEGLTVLDGEDQFSALSWSFGGVYDALQAFAEQISGATGIPLVRLLGQSPKGFSTGDSDLKMYYETIRTSQEDDLRGPVSLILGVLSRSHLGKPLPEGFNFAFNPLAAPSDLEKAQIATSDAQSAAALSQGGIIDQAQALSLLRESSRITGRFGSITDADIEAARSASAAPPVPDDVDPLPDEDSLANAPEGGTVQ